MLKTEFPYRGLAHYDKQDEDLFAGRDQEIKDCADLILRSSTSVFVLHGLSGSGKSSFIRAGLIPYLQKQATNSAVGTRLLLLPPQDLSVSTPGPLYPLALSIHMAAEQMQGKQPDILAIVNTDQETFARSRAKDPLAIYKALVSVTLATASLPIFFVDQVEQILYSQSGPAEEEARPFLELMAHLCARQVDVRICVSMRSEYKARFDDQIRGARPFALAGFYLAEMQRERLREAIERPTKGFDSKYKNFRFRRRAIDAVLDKSCQQAGVLGGPLVAAQVMCDRLYRRAVNRSDSKNPPVINREDVLALGHPNDQIQFHIQESLYEAFIKSSRDSQPLTHTPRLAARADRWFERLASLVVSLVDGRARSGACELDELLIAERDNPTQAQEIVEHLASADEYILRPDAGKYCLRHDSIALALRRWKEMNTMVATRPGTRRRRVLEAATYGEPDSPLWLDDLYPKPAILKLETIDDAIWDHLLLLFADHQHFTDRLGIELQVKQPETSGPVQPGDNLYEKFFQSDGAKAAIFPVEILNVPDLCRHIAITNVFRGYALTGPKTKAIPTGADVRAFDQYCKKFGERILPLISEQPAPPITLVAEDQRSSGDAFYYWLMGGGNRYGIGPAPTRARWKQTGQFQEWDVENSGPLWPDVRKKIADLSMHEVCIVSGVSDVAWHHRIAALVFYTVQFILSNPAEFVRYLFDYELKTRSGAVPVSRDAIQETVTASYLFTTFEAYTNDYLYPMADDYVRDTGKVRKNCRSELQTLYGDISDLRMQYDKKLLDVPMRAADDAITAQLLKTAARQYSIYNFYDATKLLQMALDRLPSSHPPGQKRPAMSRSAIS